MAAGNLPYCITADTVTMLLKLRPAGMLLMVQKEAADRFFAQPGQKNYGPVAMVSQLYYTPDLLGLVPPRGLRAAPHGDQRPREAGGPAGRSPGIPRIPVKICGCLLAHAAQDAV